MTSICLELGLNIPRPPRLSTPAIAVTRSARLRKYLFIEFPFPVLGETVNAGTISPGESPDLGGGQLRRQLGARADVELLVDLRERPLDRFIAEAEPVGDLVVRPAARDQIDDSPFLLGQLLDHR